MSLEAQLIQKKEGAAGAPFLIGLLNFILPGLGSIVLGQTKKGVIQILVRILSIPPLLLPLLLPLLIPLIPIIAILLIISIIISIVLWIFVPFLIPIAIVFFIPLLIVSVIVLTTLFVIAPTVTYITYVLFVFIGYQAISAIDGFIVANSAQNRGHIFEGQVSNKILTFPISLFLLVIGLKVVDGSADVEAAASNKASVAPAPDPVATSVPAPVVYATPDVYTQSENVQPQLDISNQ